VKKMRVGLSALIGVLCLGVSALGGAEAMRTLVNDPRSWSLSDPEYRKAVAPIRLASGPAAEPPAPPAL
jgi:hypothetical protein